MNCDILTSNFVIVDESIPAYKHKFGDAGYDMYATKDMWIFPFLVRKIPVNFMAEIPPFNFGLLTGRSGESTKGNVVIPGTIDFNYRGQMHAIMYRVGLFPRKIKKGTRIAQLVIVPHQEVRWKLTSSLSSTERGSGGFGSTGID